MGGDSFRVELVKNTDSKAKPEILVVQKDATFAKFKKDAARRLQLRQAKRVFLPSGAEIFNVDEMQANSLLYISQGEDFFKSGGVNGGVGSGSARQTYNISVLGTGGVGKSALTLRYVRDFFVEYWDPTIEDAYRKDVSVDGSSYTLEILDTAGQDDFESLRPQWMMDKAGYIFVYSMDNPGSLEQLSQFYDLHKQINEERTVPIVLVANKKDIVEGQSSLNKESNSSEESSKPIVSGEAGREAAAKMGALYIETSAASGENVKEAFELLIRQIAANQKKKTKASRKTGGSSKCVVS